MIWTHNICSACWYDRNPNYGPVKVVNPQIVTCCFCGVSTNAGIFIRHDPTKLNCVHTEAV